MKASSPPWWFVRGGDDKTTTRDSADIADTRWRHRAERMAIEGIEIDVNLTEDSSVQYWEPYKGDLMCLLADSSSA
jgi:hypothetical protein